MTDKSMTLLQEIEARRIPITPDNDHLISVKERSFVLDEVLEDVRAFADKLEGKEALDKMVITVNDELDRKGLANRTLEKCLAKAALAVVREMVG